MTNYSMNTAWHIFIIYLVIGAIIGGVVLLSSLYFLMVNRFFDRSFLYRRSFLSVLIALPAYIIVWPIYVYYTTKSWLMYKKVNWDFDDDDSV